MSSYYIFDSTKHTTSKSLDMKNYPIVNLKNPENSTDAASKKYVDDEDAKKLSLAGGTMSGNLDMNFNAIVSLKAPVGDSNASTKKYVDDTAKKYLPKSGGTMSGKINMGDNVIEGLDESSHAQSAVTKNFVVSNYVSKSHASTTYLSQTDASASFLRRNSLHPMTANLKMGNNKITSLALPTSGTDAATKSYVDAIDANLVKKNTANTFVGDNLQTIPKVIIGDLTCSWYSGSSLLFKQLYIRHPLNTSAGWFIGNQKQAPTTSDNDLYFLVRYTNGRESSPGYISDSESLTKMNDFTGQHRCVFNMTYKPELQGRVVSCTGRYQNFDGSTTPSINESLPVIELCNTIASQKVFGVLSGEEDNDRRIISGKFVSLYSKSDHRVFVNSVGEGAMWVCNANGNLQIGDYIKSFKLGYGRKQKSKTLKNSTIVKITQNCDFNDAVEVMFSGVNHKVAFVGCTYHCG